MELDFNTFSQSPLVVDLLHFLLAGLVVIFAVLWLVARAKMQALSSAAAAAEQAPKPAPVAPAAAPAPAPLQTAKPDSALQLLALLQHEARFVDFIHEDLAGFADAEIGAVARVVHEGSKKVLHDYFTIAPLRGESEESTITVAAGFDPATVRLTGNVVGQAPFTGTLIHRGWEAQAVKLPRIADGHNTAIIAPAEVEL
ncbi:MAG: DUF2760 domain-containing protein [Gammaproteobacteria bacterium]|nr:DUF2760 domain-containing protein [Gammaproteobacteria bacterium]